MNQPLCLRTVVDLRAQVAGWRQQGLRVALVPTMGALHDGHLSLVRLARQQADRIIVSIFVNPTQFAPHEDFGSYPRTFDQDMALLAQEQVECVYAPLATEIYPAGFDLSIILGGPATAGLEDRFSRGCHRCCQIAEPVRPRYRLVRRKRFPAAGRHPQAGA